ncbi:hypothetical protein [Flavobacterium sp.]|uniref:hypothetical protein n=1 Tax=Flavobacterium sp. TaxID=239 RepID=UPI003D12C43D
MLFFLLASFVLVSAQGKLGGVEFSSNEIKVLVVDLKSKETRDFRYRNNWQQKIKGENEVDSLKVKLLEGLKLSINKLLLENGVAKDKIYLMGSKSSFDDLEYKLLNKKNIEGLKHPIKIFNEYEKSYFLLDGLFKGSNQNNGFLINLDKFDSYFTEFDFRDVKNTKHISYSLNKCGFESVNQIVRNDFSNLTEGSKCNVAAESFYYQIQDIYKKFPNLSKIENIYLTGDAAWAFFVLYNGGVVNSDFNEIKLDEVIKHQQNLDRNFSRYQILATSSVESEKVLNMYTQKELLAKNALLLQFLNQIQNISLKKIYYCKNNNKATLLSYLINSN